MSDFALSQLLAACAFTLGVASFQFESRKTVLLCWFFSAGFNAYHFMILEHYTSAALIAVTAMRFLFAAYKPNNHYMYLFITFAVLSFLLTFENYLSGIGLMATLIGTVGSFSKSNHRVRIHMMAASILWATHNMLIGSPVATVMEICFFLSNLIAWIRIFGKNYFEKN